ncbi:MAG: Putative anti-sigma regulatory factor, serine/threonine protein kinase [Thermotoga sp. 50_1627]|uniref:ATP-binding protein n=1 Tax=Pseudothermotoga sp. TaxID=2033661 RepID=UPI00076D9D4B|nr:MAG: Putative anti-sigma regulatory factor, serine/threonine protein kinase [Thermotoga sp. 50_64]KUK24469.1 MAG: Putative anti-sigma regulatory factor, serine/threonine protein kinase [Thermotoga sp. 50_1627]MBC7115902.1 ATP-binding protein [Pseudothermotoga sp.]HBT39681.1 ATP-binding protein [Pseudothermotoga sp.]HCO97893.1 ATP-binding protein [Pseudothermotoga sp.]
MREWFVAAFNSNPLNTRVARSIVKTFLRQRGIAEENVWDLEIAINEALTNVIKHTYGGDQTKPVKLSILWDGEELVVFIRDYGDHVDPKLLKPRLPDPEREGGFGLYIIHKVFDSVEFSNVCQGNLLVLKKKVRGRVC